MDSADWVFIALVALVALVFILTFGLSDDEYWNKQYNGCYVQEIHNNHLFGSDVVTKTLYCPSKTTVK